MSEPENYDLNTMIDRLRSRGGDAHDDEGELVTRPDGSQAIRVRKRKRRTEQPHKKRQKRVRVLQVTAVLLLVLVLVLGVGFLMVYVNSSPFQKQVLDKVVRTTRAEAKLDQFRMNPSGANAMGLDLRWPAGNLLESASFRELSAQVSPTTFFGGLIRGQELEAASGRVLVRLPDPALPRGGPAPLGDQLPVQFSQYGVKNFSALLQVDGRRLAWLDKSEATLMPAGEQMPAQLILSRGELGLGRWPKLELDRSLLEFRGDALDLVGLRLRAPGDEAGTLEISGRLAVYDMAAPSRLLVKADAFPLSGLVGDKLGSLVSGRIDSNPEMGPSELTVRMGADGEASLLVHFRNPAAAVFHVGQFPFLFGLSQTLEDQWFSQPEFEQVVRGTVVCTSEGTELRDIELSSNKRMAVRGNLKMQNDGLLDGVLHIGVAPGMITTAENAVIEAVFGPSDGAYRWMQLQISGTATAPKDDFTQLYDRALEGLIRAPAADDARGGVPTFEDLTRPR